MNQITVNASRRYDVVIENGILDSAGKTMARVLDNTGRRVLVVTNKAVGPKYLDRLGVSLTNAGIDYEVYELENKDEAQDIESYIRIIQTLKTMEFGRSSAVVGFGGAMVCNVAGFVASTYLRGVKLIQIPTSVLATVESSVGGKSAMNLNGYKNVVGSIYQPNLVICDPMTFVTLPAEARRDGCAEIAKLGILANEYLFEAIVEMGACGGFPDEDMIAKCVSIKKHYIEMDEFDRGVRRYLNLGHTVGHAIEHCSGFDIKHGAAVAQGIVAATKIALKLGLCDHACPITIIEGLRMMGFDVDIKYTAEQLMPYIMQDTKRQGDYITLILPKTVGECINHTISLAELESLL